MAAGITLMRLTLGKQELAQELLFMAGAYTLLKIAKGYKEDLEIDKKISIPSGFI